MTTDPGLNFSVMRRLLAVWLILLPSAVWAHPHRSHSAVAAFKRAHPCPANAATKGRCPGYVVDHIKPLCAGGEDAPRNMQWQTIAEAKFKDRNEIKQCQKK